MRYLLLLGILSFSLLFVSCSDPKVDAVNQLNYLYEDLTTNSSSFTDKDWEVFIQEYAQNDSILKSYFVADGYTMEEQKQISELQGRCTAIIIEHTVVESSKELKNYLDNAGSFINGLLDQLNQ